MDDDTATETAGAPDEAETTPDTRTAFQSAVDEWDAACAALNDADDTDLATAPEVARLIDAGYRVLETARDYFESAPAATDAAAAGPPEQKPADIPATGTVSVDAETGDVTHTDAAGAPFAL